MEAGVQPTPPLDSTRIGTSSPCARRPGGASWPGARRAGQQAFHDLDEAADEAYQDAWLELVRRPAPAVDDPAGYLAGIMWHRFHRRELRPARAPAAPLDDRFASRDPAPEDVVAAHDAQRAVQEALADLPERERAAVLLRSLGLGLADVATSLGVSARRARKLSDAGHRRLAAELEDAGAAERCAAVASTLRALSLGGRSPAGAGCGWSGISRRARRAEPPSPRCAARDALRSCRSRWPAASEEGARGLVEHAAQAAARSRTGAPPGGAEASTGALGGTAMGGMLATKLVAGCVAVGVAAGCVAVVARDDAPANAAGRDARTVGEAGQATAAPAGRAPPGGATPARGATDARRAARQRSAAEREQAAVRRAVARSRRRTRGQAGGPRAQEQTRRAQQKTAACAAADAAGPAEHPARAGADPARPSRTSIRPKPTASRRERRRAGAGEGLRRRAIGATQGGTSGGVMDTPGCP